MRVVLDPNILISALLSRSGSPARLVVAWRGGSFDIVISPLLLDELRRALTYPKLRKRVSADEATEFVDWLAGSAVHVGDPGEYPLSVHSRDPGDDYLLALAAESGAVLVSSDTDLLELAEELPIYTASTFLLLIDG